MIKVKRFTRSLLAYLLWIFTTFSQQPNSKTNEENGIKDSNTNLNVKQGIVHHNTALDTDQ